MKITKKKFDLIYALYEEPGLSCVELSHELFLDCEEVTRLYGELQNDGIICDGKLTAAGQKYLDEGHSVDNAVILAAGMSTRFVPLNYEIPKGLLKVKGEVLIERQIRQLREKGIKEIIIVTGYMAERFDYLKEKYNVVLIKSKNYQTRNNHSSLLAAKKYLKNSIVTSSDLFFIKNIFQKYFYDSYYCTVYCPGKTAERGIVTDDDDKILKTMYGDRCCGVWVTLGYALFSANFSDKIIKIIENEYLLPESCNKFWADFQDSHLSELGMYAKRCESSCIKEFDSLEELREFDEQYLYDSGSLIMKELRYRLGVTEKDIAQLEPLKDISKSMFRFACRNEYYVCNIGKLDKNKIWVMGGIYYLCRDVDRSQICLYKMDKNITIGRRIVADENIYLGEVYGYVKDFSDYHKRVLPLCAAENVISDFVNLPLGFGFQERYIMNNVYSFNMADNFIGCEKLLPFYKMLAEACNRLFGAVYTDPRPFTGMNCIDMVIKTVCRAGDSMMILDKESGGHASVKPVAERLGLKVYSAPYDYEMMDLDYDEVNKEIRERGIKYILLAPSDLIKPLEVTRIDTSECVLMWDCSQLMGLIGAGLVPSPLAPVVADASKQTDGGVIMFGGTHKTFPGPASGLIMTNDRKLHDLMETEINPIYLRHSQMHQKVSLLFALLEFERFGQDYMSHVVHCSNYLGRKLLEKGFDVATFDGRISQTHQIFIRCPKEEMETIYDNAYKCEVSLNKKHKALFNGYGIRLGTQEIARYDWNDAALDQVADIIGELREKNINVQAVKDLIAQLPPKNIKFTFERSEVRKFYDLMALR